MKCSEVLSPLQLELFCDYCKRVNNPLERQRKKRKTSNDDTRYLCQPWWLDKYGNANRTIGTLRLHEKVRKALSMLLDLVLEDTFMYPTLVQQSNISDLSSDTEQSSSIEVINNGLSNKKNY